MSTTTSMYEVKFVKTMSNIPGSIKISASSKKEAISIFNRRYNIDSIVVYQVKDVKKVEA